MPGRGGMIGLYHISAYDGFHGIALMDGIVDISLPGFKLWDRERRRRSLRWLPGLWRLDRRWRRVPAGAPF
jgi:uncharacterized Fe-S radical SAM superfamily protein PflX